MLAVFVPQHIQVSVGQSVTWDNPSAVGEPHTATFCYLYITYRPCHCILLWDLQKNMDNAGDEKETQLCLTFKQPESLPKFSLYWI